VSTAFEIFGLVVLAYFIPLNALYLLFTAVSWRSIRRHLLERAYAPIDEASPRP
jgi:hypothetical protein